MVRKTDGLKARKAPKQDEVEEEAADPQEAVARKKQKAKASEEEVKVHEAAHKKTPKQKKKATEQEAAGEEEAEPEAALTKRQKRKHEVAEPEEAGEEELQGAASRKEQRQKVAEQEAAKEDEPAPKKKQKRTATAQTPAPNSPVIPTPQVTPGRAFLNKFSKGTDSDSSSSSTQSGRKTRSTGLLTPGAMRAAALEAMAAEEGSSLREDDESESEPLPPPGRAPPPEAYDEETTESEEQEEKPPGQPLVMAPAAAPKADAAVARRDATAKAAEQHLATAAKLSAIDDKHPAMPAAPLTLTEAVATGDSFSSEEEGMGEKEEQKQEEANEAGQVKHVAEPPKALQSSEAAKPPAHKGSTDKMEEDKDEEDDEDVKDEKEEQKQEPQQGKEEPHKAKEPVATSAQGGTAADPGTSKARLPVLGGGRDEKKCGEEQQKDKDAEGKDEENKKLANARTKRQAKAKPRPANDGSSRREETPAAPAEGLAPAALTIPEASPTGHASSSSNARLPLAVAEARPPQGADGASAMVVGLGITQVLGRSALENPRPGLDELVKGLTALASSWRVRQEDGITAEQWLFCKEQIFDKIGFRRSQ
eukprot:CAMPEP_0179102336 /NCGR_PEP_ID=MMETSP0796-20121207/47360_1 /TAXON_ID=73915 /ORGANISM="Pyrodinium bahamense, Strain pbaha01" /LENGTH=592 /DNA_ID=CAMNT_0020800209 /DNA_START=76 /DNA_END=1851 /DNA_ORIENTATION=-